MNNLIVTSFYGSILSIILIKLSINVVKERKKHLVGLGTGNIASLEKAMRIQSNFVEYTPLSLILIAFLEANGFSNWFVHLLGTMLVLSRIFHFIGISSSSGKSWGRTYGTILVFSCLLISAIALMGNYMKQMFF